MRWNLFSLGGTIAALIVSAALGQQSLAQTGQRGTGQAIPQAAQQFGASVPAPGTTQPAPGDPSVTGQATGPSFSIMGWPLTVSSPIGRANSNSAYTNLGGQPQRSGDAVLNWRRDGD